MSNQNTRSMRGPGGRAKGPRPKVQNPGKLFLRLLRYVMQYYRLRLLLVVVCIIVSVLASVQGTMFTKSLIDNYITPLLASPEPDFAPLGAAILRVACFYAIGVCAVYLQSRIMAEVTQGSMMHLREDLFDHMETLPISFFDTLSLIHI